MTSDLTSMKTRVRTALMDSGAAIWDDAAVSEGLRLALGEYSLAGQAAVTLSGLDEAAATTLPGLHDHAIVWGAAAYCALSRAVDRAESAQLGSQAGDLKNWGDQRLREFKAMLGSLFPGYRVVLSGSGSGSVSGEDPAKLAAETVLLSAQAELNQAQAAAVSGQEGRAAAAAQQASADRAAEAARLAELRQASGSPWGRWPDQHSAHYPADYERN